MNFKSRIYDLFTAKRYDAEMGEATDTVRQCCIEQLRINPDSKVLDLGCGTGLSIPYLADALGPEGRIIGIDGSSKMLEQARGRAKSERFDDRIQFVHGDVRRLNNLITHYLQDGKVDVVLMAFLLSAVSGWKNVFAQAFGVLAPGGRCAILDHFEEEQTWRQRLMRWKYAADSTRRGFELLRNATSDFNMDSFPAPGGGEYYIAAGRAAEPPTLELFFERIWIIETRFVIDDGNSSTDAVAH